ncbi:class I SAM-dependent methyltransferase [Spirosoma sordidisoli]|uniref:class I SAM-dependent methyltransferase n=1 Tax=Spirosoma sordidisoli TaxID=2502893 RepID=UPI0013ECBB5C|nr:class I SAM-dependent methyltransferase [Spirosoma sordidisoli]
MATNYDTIAKEYQASKMLPWRKQAESYTFFELAGDLTDLNVLDLACGEGFYTRQLKLRGAAQVTGVDISAGMIQLAHEAEAHNPLGLVYICQDALTLNLGQSFDLVTATYLLNYARTADELVQMATVIARHLKPGGRFVTINSNPDYRATVETMFPYGFTRENSSYIEGAEIIYRFYQPNGSPIAVTNYHLEKATHETALRQAGLTDIQWHPLVVSPGGIDEFGAGYWAPLLECQPVIGLSARKL